MKKNYPMKNFLFTMVFATLLSVTSYAQEQKDAVIKLKSGIEVRGEIIDQVAGEQVTLKTAEGDLFVYTMDDIVRIEDPNAAARRAQAKEELHQAKIDARIAAKDAAKQKREERALGNFKGYRGIVELSYGYDALNIGWTTNVHHASVTFINGYNCGPKFFIGIGIGCHYGIYDFFPGPPNWGTDWEYNDEISIPLFLHLRTAFTKNTRVTPYFSVNVGYNLGITPATEWCNGQGDKRSQSTIGSGIYAEPSFGLEFRCKKKTAVFFAITAPLILRTKFDGDSYNKYTISFGGKFGFSF